MQDHCFITPAYVANGRPDFVFWQTWVWWGVLFSSCLPVLLCVISGDTRWIVKGCVDWFSCLKLQTVYWCLVWHLLRRPVISFVIASHVLLDSVSNTSVICLSHSVTCLSEHFCDLCEWLWHFSDLFQWLKHLCNLFEWLWHLIDFSQIFVHFCDLSPWLNHFSDLSQWLKQFSAH